MTPGMTDGLDGPNANEFNRLVSHFASLTGIALSRDKHALVTGRLQSRLRQHGLSSYSAYLDLLAQNPVETRVFVDSLTTHETSFYREPQHFDLIAARARAHPPGRPFRAWSAACSTGEEASTLALVFADLPGLDWEVVGTDIGADTVRKAQQGLFPLSRADAIPKELRRRHCLKGVDDYEGQFRLRDPLRARLRFEVGNLLEPQPALGPFDVVLLRNVLIYFEHARQTAIVANVLRQLRPGGLLIVGHAETAHGTPGLRALESSVYEYRIGKTP